MAGILLIAREWSPRVLLRAQLEEDGHEVTGCLSPDEGLLLLRTRPYEFDLVVLDTLGLSLRSPELRALAARGLPLVVLTGPHDAASAGLANLGASKTLVRPFFVGDAAAAVEEALRKRGPRARPPLAGA